MKIIDNGFNHSSIEKYVNEMISVSTTLGNKSIQSNFIGNHKPRKIYEVYLYAFAVSGTLDTALTRFVISRGESATLKEYYTMAQLAGRQVKIVLTDADYLSIEHKTSTGSGMIGYQAIFKELK